MSVLTPRLYFIKNDKANKKNYRQIEASKKKSQWCPEEKLGELCRKEQWGCTRCFADAQAMRRVGSASKPHGSSKRLLGRSGTTYLSQIQELQYHWLGLSPDERFHRSDQERLLHAISFEMDAHDLTSGMHEYSQNSVREGSCSTEYFTGNFSLFESRSK